MRPFELDELEVEHYLQRAKRKGAGDKPYRIRLGGYPLALQDNDLEIEAARRYAENTGRQTDPVHWQLLLQLEGDAYMWGTDSGCLYLLIHQEDLQAHRFSEVVWITQGY